MTTRQEALDYGLSMPYTYQEAPFHDPNWQLVRVRGSKKAFLWTYEKDGYIHLNVKVDPQWRDYWRGAFASVIPGYHLNKEHWNTIILDGTIPDETIKCMIAGLGGLYYVMDYACGVWSNDAFGDRGWLAIALVIFTIWRPNLSVLASFLFGGLYILYLYIPTGMDHMEYQELYKMIPYVVTLVVLVITSMRSKRENQPPASLGLAYFREER